MQLVGYMEGDPKEEMLQQTGNARHRECSDYLGLYIATGDDLLYDLHQLMQDPRGREYSCQPQNMDAPIVT